ncbi:MAG TPA: hypothetical protein VGO58_04455, partial [Chitinophagaceae bacterium]|nr:hypothetical protein [Chitinophagaceae bacterium]
FPYDEDKDIMHPIHRSWSKEMRDTFAFTAGKKQGKYLPIIPDLQLLLEPKPVSKFAQYNYDIKTFPKYDARRLFDLRAAMTGRFLKMIELLKGREGKLATSRPLADSWKGHYAKKGLWVKIKRKLMGAVMNLAYKAGKKAVASKMTDAAVSMILKDLEKTGCLADPPPK